MAKSNEVLEANFESIKDTLARIEKGFGKKLDRIEDQVVRTNGRVTELESWREKIKGAKLAMNSVWGVVSVFFVAVVYAVFNMYLAFENLEQTIEVAVAKQLEEYELIIEQ